jgi:hypothetical protein
MDNDTATSREWAGLAVLALPVPDHAADADAPAAMR